MEKLDVTTERITVQLLEDSGQIEARTRIAIWDFVALHNSIVVLHNSVQLEPSEQKRLQAFYSLCELVRCELPTTILEDHIPEVLIAFARSAVTQLNSVREGVLALSDIIEDLHRELMVLLDEIKTAD